MLSNKFHACRLDRNNGQPLSNKFHACGLDFNNGDLGEGLEEETVHCVDFVEEVIKKDEHHSEEQAHHKGPKKTLAAAKSISFRGRSEEIERNMYKTNRCGLIVRAREFDQLCAVVIVMSSLLVGVEVEFRSDSNALVFDILSYIFITFYTAELAIRVGARGRTFLAKSPDQSWNIFDLFCVISSYVELILSQMLAEENGSLLLLLRTVRLVRIARIIRVVRFLGNLRLMVHTVLGAMRMLGWASLLIVMITYMVSVCFTEAAKGVLQHNTVQFSGDRIALDSYFGTLPKSMMSLFQSIANGVSWRQPMLLLEDINGMYAVLSMMYISISVLTILNVITGLCCDYAINNANVDRDDAIRSTLKEIDKWKKQFSFTFKSLDRDDSGEISSDELAQMLYDQEFNAYLSYLNVSVDDVFDIFDVFDIDGSGQVSLEEFVSGCMKVKGFAKSLDVMKVKKDIMIVRQEIASLRVLLQTLVQR
eukprot:TRINITY_DN110562_c0_g1_i1.p1 TRINITY_DN110562_c0_g1~~TRINITY_DN110562_c0_g1_i1.p1  ORF type:complete len:520 (+),score=67.26 TRINITY_DN110562_c0_g1_i1:129-1562(+)